MIKSMLNGAKRGFAKSKKVLAGACVVGITTLAHAQTPTVDDIVTDVGGITTEASAKYVVAAGLGVAALTVGVIVRMSRRGWSLK